MRICFDLTIDENYTGIGQVADKYLTELKKIKNIEIIKYGKSKSLDYKFGFPSYYNILQHVKFYFFLKKNRPEVLFIPHYFLPFLIPKNIKIYVIVHDVMAITRANIFFGQFARLKSSILFYLLKYNLSFRNNLNIITPSYSVSKEIQFLFNKKSLVIPNGLFEILDLGILPKENFYLYIGNSRRHKNILNLLDYFINQNRIFLKVISILKSMSNYNSNYVHIIGKVESKIDVLKLISSSQGVIIPSFCEGFGLPVIESIYYSGKAFASDIDVFKEFYGLNVDYFNPHSLNQLDITLNFSNSYIPRSTLKINNLFDWQELVYFIKNEFI
jgi:glycosyltransferase involved in cell wall biosynthesis